METRKMHEVNVFYLDWIQELRRNWAWILAFGCLLILVGIFAVAYSALFTLVSVIVLGWILIVAGVIEAIQALRHRAGVHLLIYLLEALLSFVAGVLMLRTPEVGALVMTLMLAVYFTIVGIVRIVAALTLRLPAWGWTIFTGLLTLALGLIVWGGWPVSGLWVIGLFIGIQMIFGGWARVMLALALRSSPHQPLAAA
jgi:uncharacterized membrane protein HdeD (DUF308 family)